MTLHQWLGVWVLVAAAVICTATAVAVVGGLTLLTNQEGRSGGCRGRGCRRDAGRHGCTTAGAGDGPTAPDLATLARVGRVDLDTVRKRESK